MKNAPGFDLAYNPGKRPSETIDKNLFFYKIFFLIEFILTRKKNAAVNVPSGLSSALTFLWELYDDLERETLSFQNRWTLRCPPLCGHCCNRPARNIETTLLEMLPVAMEMVSAGRQENLRMLFIGKKPEEEPCLFYQFQDNPDQGQCSIYENRALICRLFGFSGQIDKYGKPRIALCKMVTKEHSTIPSAFLTMAEESLPFPIFTHYGTRLKNLYPRATDQLYPINISFLMALEYIESYTDLLSIETHSASPKKGQFS